MLRALTLACGLLAAAPLPLAAEVPDGVVSVRLLPGWRTDTGTHMAGLEIQLAPGWKTYWRAPGDAGIPPSFQWSDVDNVSAMNLHWPVPEVHHINGMRSIGYTGTVVIPIEFTVGSTGVAHIGGNVELGVCSDICMPVEVPISADLPVGGTREPVIIAALTDRPLSGAEAGVRSANCNLSTRSGDMVLRAEIRMPPAGNGEEVVIESGSPSLWVGDPMVTRSGDSLIAEAPIAPMNGDGIALNRSAVRISVFSGTRAVEIDGC
ncbi:protein-disulfide reductase DsbD domain-containing protein [Pelagovum pacificum]|uniref:Thiol:disulfide interchange protein DsbD N-terminal domain-containing protein n=1 Tax=Pelagovum pacificum TaxID=2588711 RepID=A0A5C5GBY6_9RHOB|nr:protein-disulfide reductase DsbD domain-containing protein [Pelagovum pacificum]QQA42409.1 hypothetical protein I8N54_16705 [Pelagovum pacificum]TNY31492.1 hypothetical protein FHY64_15895 [Pelagovum pacificum]